MVAYTLGSKVPLAVQPTCLLAHIVGLSYAPVVNRVRPLESFSWKRACQMSPLKVWSVQVRALKVSLPSA